MNELTITHFRFKKCFAIEVGYLKWGSWPEMTGVLFLGRHTANILSNLSGIYR